MKYRTVSNGMGLTPGQADCARVVCELTHLLGRRPTLRELAAELDLASKSTVIRYLAALAERGWVRVEGGRPVPVLLRDPPPLDVTPFEITAAGAAALATASAG